MQLVTTLKDRQSKVAMIDVQSSNIQQIGYSERTARLFIRFKDGGRLYRYDPTPPVVWLGLLYSVSKGRYLETQIKPYFRATRAKETDLEETQNGN